LEPGLEPRIRVFPTLSSASSAAARHIAGRARASVRARGRFSWVLAGGRTPQGLYRILASRYRGRFPWRETEIFFGDERCVPPKDPSSNYAMVREALLDRVPIPPRSIHRMGGEVRPASEAAARYARLIGRAARGTGSTEPRFDLLLLGIGPDGHTASLFPGAPSLRERRRSVVSVRRPGQPPWVPRLTLTIPALDSSREACFLVSGDDKAPAVRAIFDAPTKGDPRFPASLVRSAGPTTWFMDRSAAAGLSPLLSRAAFTGAR
jgi:6-phosphogluconolactonase